MISPSELRRIPQLNKLIERKQEQLIYLREKATSIPSTLPDHDRVQTSPSGTGNRYVEAAVDLSKEIVEMESALGDLKMRAANFIDTLPDSDSSARLTKRVLKYRYLDCLYWDEIADLVGYNVRYLSRLERNALIELQGGQE